METSSLPVLPKVGQRVEVISGPWVHIQPIRGKVEEVTAHDGGAEVMVRVASGGLWGFEARDLKVIR